MDNNLMPEGQKLLLQIILMSLFSEYASIEEVCNSEKPPQNTYYFKFFFPPIVLTHTSGHPASLSHKYPNAFTFGEIFSHLLT